jgi:hypothetical protein
MVKTYVSQELKEKQQGSTKEKIQDRQRKTK